MRLRTSPNLGLLFNDAVSRVHKQKSRTTKDTAFRGRRKAKRVRLRKLQRNARRVQR